MFLKKVKKMSHVVFLFKKKLTELVLDFDR